MLASGAWPAALHLVIYNLQVAFRKGDKRYEQHCMVLSWLIAHLAWHRELAVTGVRVGVSLRTSRITIHPLTDCILHKTLLARHELHWRM